MERERQIASWLGATLGTVCALLVLALGAHASDQSCSFSEEFHQTYAVTPDARLELDNIDGPVHISTCDCNEIKVDAVKRSHSKEKLEAAHIEVDAGKDHVSIRTRYRDHDLTFGDEDEVQNNPASVEYTLTVPRNARLDEIKLINGSLDIAGVSGEVRASCINGRLQARDLSGRVRLSTINGRLEAQFNQLTGSPLELNSVNGALEVTIPSDSKAEIEASTISGDIENDFGLHVNRHRFVGRDLRGELAGGGPRLELRNVNGRIEVRHASDGRALSPVKDLSHRDRNDKDDDGEDDEI